MGGPFGGTHARASVGFRKFCLADFSRAKSALKSAVWGEGVGRRALNVHFSFLSFKAGNRGFNSPQGAPVFFNSLSKSSQLKHPLGKSLGKQALQ